MGITQSQLQQNIDSLQSQGASNSDVQGYINTLSKSSDGTYAPRSSGISLAGTPAGNMLESMQNGKKVMDNAVASGVSQAEAGYQQFKNSGGNPIQATEGALGGVAGVINMALSPLAPFMQPVSNGINAVADKISDIPAVQSFANTGPGKAVAQGAQDVNNIATIAGAVAGADVKAPKASPDFSGPTSAIEDPPAPPSKLNPETQSIVDKRTDALTQIERGNGPVRRVSNYATAQGIDVKSLVANTDLLHDSVDENGAIDTTSKGGAMDQFNSFMNQYEDAVSAGLKREGRSIPISQVKDAMQATVDSSGVAGAAKIALENRMNTEIQGLTIDADPSGNISLSKIQDAKTSTTNTIDYTNPASKINAKMMASVYKTIIEDNSSLPIKEVNAELSKYYTIGDYLESLNGKKVQGGRLGKYFAQTVGAVAGSHFGVLGSIIGAELAGKIKGSILADTFGQEISQGLQASDLLKNQVAQNALPRIALPAPAEGAPRSSIGSGNPIPLMPRMNDSTPAYIPQAPGGRIKTTPPEMMAPESYTPSGSLPIIKMGTRGKTSSSLPTIKY